MKWSFKVGRILGIDVYLHFTFLLLLGFVGFMEFSGTGSVWAAWRSVVYLVGLFGCVLLHEYGHALTARHYGIPTRDITLLPIGGLARLERMPDKPVQELWVALAGPAVNVVIALGIYLGLRLSGAWDGVIALSATQGSLVERLLVVNIFLVLFNLLPAFPMDGGRVLRAALAMRLPYGRATRVAAAIGKGMAVLFGFIGLFGNPMLMLIALFVWIGADQEAAAAEMKTTFSGLRARDAMLTDFKVLTSDLTLGEVVRILLSGSQQEFPVAENGRLAGALGRPELFEGLRQRGENALVREVMRPGCSMASADDPLEDVLSQAQAGQGMPVAVVEEGLVIGLVTMENVTELFMVRAALGSRPRHRPPPLPADRLPPIISPRPGAAGITGSLPS